MELSRRRIRKASRDRARQQRERSLFADDGCDLERYIVENVTGDPEFARLYERDSGRSA